MAASFASSSALLFQTPRPTLSLPRPYTPLLPFSLSLRRTHRLASPPALKVTAAAISPSPPPSAYLLSDSTRTVSTLLAAVFALTRLAFGSLAAAFGPTAAGLSGLRSLPSGLAGGALFFARALKDRPSGYLNTPLTVVASGMAKWLDIYSGVLMVRVLLSWFPNIPWDRQPLSAIRDLCDPYLNLFRNIIPPIFDTLDVSPLLAFAVLGTLGSILNNSRGMY